MPTRDANQLASCSQAAGGPKAKSNCINNNFAGAHSKHEEPRGASQIGTTKSELSDKNFNVTEGAK